ncbi:MAG: DUF6798 domain-containing protein [Pirellulales bacterium]
MSQLLEDSPPVAARSRWSVAAEIALIFAVFFVEGAWPVPDVNEPHYLGKAKHSWNADWAPGDFFFNTPDAHQVFDWTVGWLSMWMSLPAFAWTGRILTWALLAWAWRRFSFAVVPKRWLAPLSAALFVAFLNRCNMAGEWVVGGLEAKGFAFVLVFLGLEAVAQNRWNRAWLLLGAASGFHALVGGWSTLAAGVAWLAAGKDRPGLRSMAPALVGGLLLSLPGLLPVLLLDWGVDPKITSQAHQLYVFERLPHHLLPERFTATAMSRQGMLLVLWLLLSCLAPGDGAARRVRGWVAGAIAIALVGLAIGWATSENRPLAAGLLRFYWFRLSDVALPVGAALAAIALVAAKLETRRASGAWWLAGAMLLGVAHLGEVTARRYATPSPRADRLDMVRNYADWLDVCHWVARETPPDALFLTPRQTQTFTWHADRGEVVCRKNIPQNAEAIVEWWRRLNEIYKVEVPGRGKTWARSLTEDGEKRLEELGAKYKAGYVLTFAEPRLNLPEVYRNGTYAVYRLPKPKKIARGLPPS